MRRAAAFIIAALMLVSGILAAPVTKPASPPARAVARSASQPTTAPARMTPEQVAAFDGHFLGAKWEDVAAALKATGAVADGPNFITDGGKGKFRRVLYNARMGYPFEYGVYGFTVDDAGLVYKYQFTPAPWPVAPGTDPSFGPEYNKLKPGNKWWLVKSVTFSQADSSGARLDLTQAGTAAEAAKKLVAQHEQIALRRAKAMKKEAADWERKMIDVEAHEWFTPLIQKHQEERVD